MRRISMLLLAVVLLLCACGGEGTPQPPLTEEPLVLPSLTLECSAPASSDGGFPAAANAFGAALQGALGAEGVEIETLHVTFSRVDAATADALESGGVTLGILGLGGTLVEEGDVLLALRRNGESLSEGALFAGESAYGTQLVSRSSPLSAEEWSRAAFGAVEGDRALLAAARQLLHESAGYAPEEYRAYATAEELLSAAKRGEVDAAILRAEDAEGLTALTESAVLYEGTVVLSPGAAELRKDAVREALIRAFISAAESDAGKELLQQYGCGGFMAVNDEEVGAMRRLAIWEELE